MVESVTTGEEFPEAGGVDQWAAYLPGQELIPAYLSSRFAAQYRAIVDVILEAQDTSLTGMSHDEVSTQLQAWVRARTGSPETADRLVHEDVFALDARLDRLVQWGVLTRWQEPARTGEDFLRRRDRFQLTPTAARPHRPPRASGPTALWPWRSTAPLDPVPFHRSNRRLTPSYLDRRFRVRRIIASLATTPANPVRPALSNLLPSPAARLARPT